MTTQTLVAALHLHVANKLEAESIRPAGIRISIAEELRVKDKFVATLTAIFMGQEWEDGYEETIDTEELYVSTVWWDAFKLRWFPAWLFRWFDRPNECLTMSTTKRRTVYNICPHIDHNIGDGASRVDSEYGAVRCSSGLLGRHGSFEPRVHFEFMRNGPIDSAVPPPAPKYWKCALVCGGHTPTDIEDCYGRPIPKGAFE